MLCGSGTRTNDLDSLIDVLRKVPSKELAKAARIGDRPIRAIRHGYSGPSAKTRNRLLRAAKRLRNY